MEDISKINYTFNYDGRSTSSFDNAYKGLIKVLENSDSKVLLEIEFPITTAMSKEQKDLINKALLDYKREPIFR